ncbi:MAG: hypothetical protein ACQEXC_15210 [Pseudomonadota bacterium]
MFLRTALVAIIIAVIYGGTYHLVNDWAFYYQYGSYMIATLIYAAIIGIVRSYCIVVDTSDSYGGSSFRKYTIIEEISVRGRDFLTMPMVLLLTVVIFFIGLAIDPINPFRAIFAPLEYGTMVERPAEIGTHAFISLWIFAWMIWGIRDAVIGTLDTITGKLSYERYRFIVDNYGYEHLNRTV